MEENEILTQVIDKFNEATEYRKSKAKDAVSSYAEFFDFVEKHDDLKDNIYGFFYKLLDDYISYKYYTMPIPALADNKEYMENYRKQVIEQANTFFNFGGIVRSNNNA